MARDLLLLLGLVLLPGCAGEFTALAAMVFSMSLGAWLVGRGHHRRALLEAMQLRRAIATGRHRQIEQHLRRELALAELLVGLGEVEQIDDARGAEAEAFEAALDQRGRLARAPHAGEAQALERGPGAGDGRLIRGRDVAHAQVTITADATKHDGVGLASEDIELVPTEGRERLEMRRQLGGADRVDLPRLVESPLRDQETAELGARQPLPLDAHGLARGRQRQLAASRYEQATHAFPGTRLASEARARCHALDAGRSDDLFRGMLPEAPMAVRERG